MMTSNENAMRKFQFKKREENELKDTLTEIKNSVD